MHLIDATMFYGPRSGGVKRYLQAKHQWLARHASSVRHSLLVPVPHTDASYTIGCHGAALPLPDDYRLPLAVHRWYRTLIELQPDIIEAADPYVPGWAARLVASRYRVPAIAFYHSDMPRMLSARVGSWINPVARRYLRALYDGFDLVLAPSRVMLERLAQVGVEAQLQSLGVDVERFNPQTADSRLRERLGVSRDTRLLVYAGRFAREKNLEVLVQLADRLGEPYHLVLIGGQESIRISRRVTVLPYQQSTSHLASLVASCDVFVHAGDQETYGLVAAEALACGVPVVGVDCGAIPEIVDENVGALAAAPRASLLAAAIDGVFSRDLPALKRAARSRAVMSHSWDLVFRSLLSRYVGLVSPSVSSELRHIGTNASQVYR